VIVHDFYVVSGRRAALSCRPSSLPRSDVRKPKTSASEALPYEETKHLIEQRLQKQQLEKLLTDLRAKAKME
jgi:hypothetical protein